MRQVQTVYQGTTGQRIGRFLALLGIVFVVSLAVIVSQRFSTETLALIVGLLLAGIPLLAIAALLGFIAAKALKRQQQSSQMMIPPIVMQIPQPHQNAFPGDGGAWDTNDLRQRPGASLRQWDTLGED